jgi:hypothetical protein
VPKGARDVFVRGQYEADCGVLNGLIARAFAFFVVYPWI